MNKKVNLSVIIPTYNERENIILLIKETQAVLKRISLPYEIIVVDDNSPDLTGAAVKKEFKNKNIRAYVRKNDKGLATAILFGIKRSKGDIVICMDADFNHPAKKIPELLSDLQNSDLVVASRFIKNGGMEDKFRYLFTYLFNFFLKRILGFPTMDNLSGFYAIRKNKLLTLPLNFIYNGYGEYHLRLVYLAQKYGLRIKETPVYYPKRKYGYSKSNLFKMFFIYLQVAFSLKYSDEKI